MIRRQWVDSGFDIGEVLPEQGGHIGVETAPRGHWRVGMTSRPRTLTGALARRIGQSPHDGVVTDIPGNPRQLACTIGDAGGEAREGIGHAVAQRCMVHHYNMSRKEELVYRAMPAGDFEG